MPGNDDRVRLTQPHIAVVLPLQSASFGRHADAVRLGVQAAANLQQDPSLPVIVYATTEDPPHILDTYERALAAGARAVIGPLTRSGVSALAGSSEIRVPTLALNVPELDAQLPRGMLYVFGLQIESEARQVALYALRQGGTSAFIVVGDTPLGRRIAQAFSEEWRNRKGEIAEQFEYSTEPAMLAKLRERLTSSSANTVFLSVDSARARFIRPYLGTRQTIYATSLVFASNADALEAYDLEGVRFMDMPWLLEPDNPAVITYLRPELKTTGLEMERLYALGIDAYRIVHAMLTQPDWNGSLDGVTGTVRLEGQQFVRDLVPAEFAGGTVRAVSVSR
ncbi:MAG TPA: penicillin-binding protein activator [Burkholderiales bacterium]|nr:penicillin-binding protein activator [Burkholderiales bacterium]